MVSKTAEQSLEAYIEKALTGTCKEERGREATARGALPIGRRTQDETE